MNGTLLDNAKALPLVDRIQLLEALWESVTEEGYEPQLTAEQAAELDRRLEAHQSNPDDVVPWDAIKSELESKYSER